MLQERYLDIVAAVETEFARNRRLHGERIHCRAGCSDCCSQPFQITEIEAEFISEGMARLEPEEREALRTRAREYGQARETDPGLRLPCPALMDAGVCGIYDHRPLMCHKFGMPLYNPEKPDRIFACELNFQDGEEIDDPQLIQIQTVIHQAWKELQSDFSAEGGYRDPKPLTVARAILRD